MTPKLNKEQWNKQKRAFCPTELRPAVCHASKQRLNMLPLIQVLCWIPADSVCMQVLLFLALLQFSKRRFETEKLQMSSEVSQTKSSRVTVPKIIVTASNMCL